MPQTSHVEMHFTASEYVRETVIGMSDGFFPLNVRYSLKMLPEVCRIFYATANPTDVVLAESHAGRGIFGVIDGFSPRGTRTRPNSSDAKTSCGRSDTNCDPTQ